MPTSSRRSLRGRRSGSLGKRAHKYGAKRTRGHHAFREIASRHFDSKFEASVAVDLCIRQRAKEISDLKFQQTVFLTEAKISWKIDFSYMEDGQLIYHEAKGCKTEAYSIKLKLYRTYGPAPLRVTEGSCTSKITREFIPRKG